MRDSIRTLRLQNAPSFTRVWNTMQLLKHLLIQTKTSYRTSSTVVVYRGSTLTSGAFIFESRGNERIMNMEEVRNIEEWKSNMKWHIRGGHREKWRAIVGGWNIQMLLCLCPLNEARAKKPLIYTSHWKCKCPQPNLSMSDKYNICFLSPLYVISTVEKHSLHVEQLLRSIPFFKLHLHLTSFSLMNIYKSFTIITITKNMVYSRKSGLGVLRPQQCWSSNGFLQEQDFKIDNNKWQLNIVSKLYKMSLNSHTEMY